MYRFAFVLDQQVGLRTQALNLQSVVAGDAEIDPVWVPVRYEVDGGLLTRLPGIPSGMKGTLRGVREIRDGFRKSSSGGAKLDAALWATWAAKSVRDLVAAAPAYLVMDMTPVQMEAMGEQYGYTRARAHFLGGWKHWATLRLYEQAARIFPWNEWVAASLRDDYGIPAEKITSVSPGVDTRLYRPDPAARPDDGVVRLLFVGGDFLRKGGDLMLRWAQEAASTAKTASWELHIVTRDAIDAIAACGPRVVAHRGLQNNSHELVRLYQQCDIFVLPTRADCYSLVALEAMASGLPVIISRLAGIPDIVQDGETGFLVDVEDYASLTAALDRLICDAQLRACMGRAGLERARTRFDCHANIGRILAEMKSCTTEVGRAV